MTDKLTQLWATKTKDDEWWSSFVTAPLGILANYAAVEVPWVTPNRITAAWSLLWRASEFLSVALHVSLQRHF